MSSKVATTFNIDKEIKTSFKIECVKNGVEMGQTVEIMMSDYVKASQELHAAIREKNG